MIKDCSEFTNICCDLNKAGIEYEYKAKEIYSEIMLAKNDIFTLHSKNKKRNIINHPKQIEGEILKRQEDINNKLTNHNLKNLQYKEIFSNINLTFDEKNTDNFTEILLKIILKLQKQLKDEELIKEKTINFISKRLTQQFNTKLNDFSTSLTETQKKIEINNFQNTLEQSKEKGAMRIKLLDAEYETRSLKNQINLLQARIKCLETQLDFTIQTIHDVTKTKDDQNSK